jgi:hypothetical protein
LRQLHAAGGGAFCLQIRAEAVFLSLGLWRPISTTTGNMFTSWVVMLPRCPGSLRRWV